MLHIIRNQMGVKMFIVISAKNYAAKIAAIGTFWCHATAEKAIAHAQARSRFDGGAYVVLRRGGQFYSTEM